MEGKKTIFLFILIMLTLFLFSGCMTNNTPVIEEISNQIAKVDQEFTYQVIAHDPNNSELDYVLTGEPEVMQISSNGVITWTPGENQIGTYTIEVEVHNNSGSSLEEFTITVEPVYLSSMTISPSLMTINKGQSATIKSVTANYDDGSAAVLQLNACTYKSNVASVTVSNGIITVSTSCGVPSAKITVSYTEGDITKNAIVTVMIPGGGG